MLQMHIRQNDCYNFIRGSANISERSRVNHPSNSQPILRGRVFDMQRMSIHDGPGIRTTVFLKGCPLRCVWCHNPESILPEPQLTFTPALCVGCGECLRRCPNNAHDIANGAHRLDRSRCARCLACVEACCGNALRVVGREMTVDEVVAEVLRDNPFYEESGGGMTLSGGEPLAQAAFTQGLLRAAREHGLHTCLETSGFGATDDALALVPLVDLFLFDIKDTDPTRHRTFTGQSNTRILENLRRLDAAGASIILRCIMIPEVNLDDTHLKAIASLAGSLRGLRGVDVMGCHALGQGKRPQLGIPEENYSPRNFTALTRAQLERVVDRLQALGCAEARML